MLLPQAFLCGTIYHSHAMTERKSVVAWEYPHSHAAYKGMFATSVPDWWSCEKLVIQSGLQRQCNIKDGSFTTVRHFEAPINDRSVWKETRTHVDGTLAGSPKGIVAKGIFATSVPDWWSCEKLVIQSGQLSAYILADYVLPDCVSLP